MISLPLPPTQSEDPLSLHLPILSILVPSSFSLLLANISLNALPSDSILGLKIPLKAAGECGLFAGASSGALIVFCWYQLCMHIELSFLLLLVEPHDKHFLLASFLHRAVLPIPEQLAISMAWVEFPSPPFHKKVTWPSFHQFQQVFQILCEVGSEICGNCWHLGS